MLQRNRNKDCPWDKYPPNSESEQASSVDYSSSAIASGMSGFDFLQKENDQYGPMLELSRDYPKNKTKNLRGPL